MIEPPPVRIPTWRKVVMVAYTTLAVLMIVGALTEAPRILALAGLAQVFVALGVLGPRHRESGAEEYAALGLALLMGVMVAVILVAVGLELGLALYLGGVAFLVLVNVYVVATLVRAFRSHEVAW